ncbi:MAG: S8 family peptidase [Methylobacter sp.]
MAACLTTSVAFGAQVEPSEYEKLLKEATSTGTVRVAVSIDDTLTLEAVSKNPAAVRAAMEQRAKPLLAELGPDALEAGYWNNGMGQIGIYVTPNGLKILTNSSNAKSFMPDVTSKSHFRVQDGDGSIDAIEAAINAKGFADVEVFLNIDKGDYDIGKDGKTTFRPSPELSIQIMTRLANINAARFASGFKNFDKSPSEAAKPSPSFRVRIDKEAFYGLRESDNVRAIRPIDFVDARPAQWPTDVLEKAQADGSVEVGIALRGGAIYSPKTGHMSAAALKAQADANQRAFNDILSSAGVSLSSAAAASHFGLGSLYMRLPYSALAQLYQNADPRILSIGLNRPAAKPALTNSTALLNMQPTWSLGYRAAGQIILIIDTGVRKDHELFKMNGTTKVAYEACFGTNNGNFQSICPNQNTYGDSPLGQLGSGEPFSNLTECARLTAAVGDLCSHGTHVAGIAAGHSSPNVSPSTLQGIAPDANLISVQVASYNAITPYMDAFAEDIYQALLALDSGTTSGPNNYVVNMSISESHQLGDCGNYFPTITPVIEHLTSRGIPVVAGTGNDSYKDGIGWPACVPHAIKVSSVANDATGTDVSWFANIAAPGNFTGPFLLAPGGGINSASSASTTATEQLMGTSMASPHAAGVYAAIKAAVPGISVADATAWIVTSGSIPVTYTLPAPAGTQTYRRLRMPF